MDGPGRITVTIGGSRKIPPGHAGRLLIRFLANLPGDAVIHLRAGNSRTGRFERDVAELCDMLTLAVRWWRPDLGPGSPGGREATFQRDEDMVGNSSLLLAFTTEQNLEAGASGTLNLVEIAQTKGVPVYAYGVGEKNVWLIGATDPQEAWRQRVMSA